jgi:hypothetical protein
MVLLAKGSPLITNSTIISREVGMTRKVRVLRSFYFNRKNNQAGDIIELPEGVYKEELAVQRVELIKEESTPEVVKEEVVIPGPSPEPEVAIKVPEPVIKGRQRNVRK